MNLTPLIDWFERNSRQLPWRENRSPWGVLVSEIMLQQTQVATVIPYYERWMKRFPNPTALATADSSEVLKMWEDLGYYKRARALHAAAQAIHALGGSVPNCENKLLSLPGIGPYTAAAIVAFAFQQRSAPVDGNVLRVLTRLLGLRIDIAKSSSHKAIRNKLLEILPTEKPWIVAESLIELGATICRMEPLCQKCPLQSSCYAFRNNEQSMLPVKTKKQEGIILYRNVGVIHSTKDRWLVCQKHSAGIFQGLWLFTYMERDELGLIDEGLLAQAFEEKFQLQLEFKQQLTSRKHTFTKHTAHLQVFEFHSKSENSIASSEHWHYEWVDSKQLQGLTFCSGHRDIRRDILHSY